MKIKVNRKKFRRAFATAASILASRDPSPIGSVLLSPKDGHLLLSSTNKEMVIRTMVEASCDIGPNVLLPWRVRPAISSIKTEDVTLELLENAVQISGGTATITLRTSPPQLYPGPQQIAIEEKHVEISSTLFRRAVRSTAFATLTFVCVPRLMLQCVNVAVSHGKMTFTSSDGTRVAQYVADVISSNVESEYGPVLIQPHFLTYLSRLARDSTVKMCIKNDTYAIFGLGDSIVAAVPLASGSFPKMDAVFATFHREVDHYETVKLNTAELAALLARASVMSTKDHQVVRLSVAEHRLWSEMRTPEVGESRSSIDVASWANQKPVTLDVQHLRDGLAVLYQNERVWLSIPDKALPLKLSTDNFTYIVMPFSDKTQQRHAYNDAIVTSQRPGARSD